MTKKLGIGAAAVAAAAAITFGGVAISNANAADNNQPTATAGAGDASRPRHTEVTGDEAAKVSAAVSAKDSAVTVNKVFRHEDGSYDVVGTKDGARVHGEVSADLATVSLHAGGPRIGKGPMGHNHTEVTGDEAAKVSAAVTAKDSAVTVETVLKDDDGSYDVIGSKAGAPIAFEVSADLATVTERTGGPGRGPLKGNHTVVTGDEAAKVSAAVTAKDPAVTVEMVVKDEDGSYHVLATKAGAPVGFRVSADLTTITERGGGPGMGGRHGQGPGMGGRPGSQSSSAPTTTT